MADAGAIKNMNIDAVRRALHRRGPLSKSELAYETGLSFPTISRTIDILTLSGELLEKGLDNSTGGRCAKIYTVNPLFSTFLLLRLEGREINWFVNNLVGEKIDGGMQECKEGLLHAIDLLIEKMQVRYPQLGAVVLGVAGIINNGMVIILKDCEELWGVNLLTHIQDKFKLPTVVINDMKAAAAGYWSRHTSQPTGATVCMYLGKNGIGTSIVINGTVWHGANEFAGEITYLPIEENTNQRAENDFSTIDMIDYYGKIIQSYTALLNPERIVLYENKYISNRIDSIRKFCVKSLPPTSIPQMEISREFTLDYECGLSSIAFNLLTNFPEDKNKVY